MTQSYTAEFTAVAQAFNTAWQSGSPLTPITPVAWPGLPFTMPTDANGNRTTFAVFNISSGEAQQISIGKPGTNVFRHPELLSLKIYTPQNLGEIPALQLADTFCEIFRNMRLSGIVFKTPYIQRVGNTDEGMYLINCFCPFERDSHL